MLFISFCLFFKHHMTEGLDLYDDVLTTGGEIPVEPEDEESQTQVRTTWSKIVISIKPSGKIV